MICADNWLGNVAIGFVAAQIIACALVVLFGWLCSRQTYDGYEDTQE